MKIRITGKRLEKAQSGKDIHKSLTEPGHWWNIPDDNTTAPPEEQKVKPNTEANNGVLTNASTDPLGLDNWLKDKTGSAGEDKLNPYSVPDVPAWWNPNTKAPRGNSGMGIYNALEAGNAIGNLIQQPQKQAEWDAKARQQRLTDNSQAIVPENLSGNRGDYDINNGMFRPNEEVTNKGMYTNKFYTPQAQMGITVPPDALGNVTPSLFNPNNSLSSFSNTFVPVPVRSVGESKPAEKVPGQTTYGPGPITQAHVKDGMTALDHNNPGNIHISAFAQKYGAVAGRPDVGGKVAVFPDMATGFKAMEDLLFSKNYNNLTISQARERWVGHDGWQDSARDMVRAIGGDKKLKDLTPDERDIYMGKITKWENIPAYYKELKKMGLLHHQEGGDVKTNTNMKIRITGGPGSVDRMAYGGQKGYGFDLGQRNTYSKMNDSSFADTSSNMHGVPREEANIEAEGGETVYGDLDGDGMMEHKTIVGPRHSSGGTPLNVPEGSFIFSDTKKMKIKDPEILKKFGKGATAGGVTPADLAKQYNLTKYKAVLQDPLSDPLAKKTAEMMISNYNKKLSELATVQEGMKGFPQGRPHVAQQGSTQQIKAQYGGLQKFQGASGPSTVGASLINHPPLQSAQSNTTSDVGNVQGILKGADLASRYPWYKPFTSAHTKAGQTTPTGENSLYTGSVPSQYENIPYWEKRHGSPFKSMNEFQGYMYDELNQHDPSTINTMWNRWGRTFHGPKNKMGFADDKGGARTAFTASQRIWDTPKPIPEQEVTIPGEHTMTVTRPEKRKDENTDLNEIPHKPGLDINYGGKRIGSPWWAQDKNNLANAAMNWAGNKKYLPFMPDVSLQHANPVFEDWRGQAAALESGHQNNARIAGTYGPASALATNLSSDAGAQAEKLAGIIGQTNDKNIGTANQFAQQQANTMNTETSQRAQNRAEMWKGNVIANQQYDNANREGRANFVNALNTGMTNAANTYNLNMSESPYYKIDPRSGGAMYFNSPSSRANFMNERFGNQGNQNDDFLAKYNAEYKRANSMFSNITDPTERNNRINHYLDNFTKMHSETNRATAGAWGQPKGYTTVTHGER